MAIPPTFNEEFLLWFRARTEATWKKVPARSIEDFLAQEEMDETWYAPFSQKEDPQTWHPSWRGAKWLEPLADEEIDAIERQWQIRFPPDYHLFFKMLHATDRPRLEFENIPGEYSTGLFFNWQKAPFSIQRAYEHIVGGFAFQAIHHWRSEWGAAPLTEKEARERLKPIVDVAPRLIPLYAHRYLLAEPCQAGNPVLSIWGSDIIIIAPDLRTYLLGEFGDNFSGSSLLRLTTHDQKEAREERKRLWNERKHEYESIPFWEYYLPQNE